MTAWMAVRTARWPKSNSPQRIWQDRVVGSRLRNQKRKQSNGLLFSFLERCLPLRASDVAFGSDVHCVSDVTPNGVVGKHHITATNGSYITMRSITSLRQRRNITLYKLQNLWYNIIENEVLLWLNPSFVNYQWIFPLTLSIMSKSEIQSRNDYC